MFIIIPIVLMFIAKKLFNKNNKIPGIILCALSFCPAIYPLFMMLNEFELLDTYFLVMLLNLLYLIYSLIWCLAPYGILLASILKFEKNKRFCTILIILTVCFIIYNMYLFLFAGPI